MMVKLIILFVSFFTSTILFSLCKISGDSDRLAETIKLRDPIKKGVCDCNCVKCSMRDQCSDYIVMREG